jgi:hypothetical protein
MALASSASRAKSLLSMLGQMMAAGPEAEDEDEDDIRNDGDDDDGTATRGEDDKVRGEMKKPFRRTIRLRFSIRRSGIRLVRTAVYSTARPYTRGRERKEL